MNVWYHLSTILNQRRVLRLAGILTLCVAFITMLFFSAVSNAAPGINQTISFQARLLTSGGTPVPNGFYNIQFKIYEGGSGAAVGNPDGTLKWTETYTNNGAQTGVKVTNGYMSVNLGSQTAFGSSVNWNDNTLWLSMNIAGLTTGCSTFNTENCVADGEMTPMKRLTATPYALNAGMLGGISADGYLKVGDVSQDGSYNITGTGRANTLQGNNQVISPMFDRADAGTLTVGGTNATEIEIGSTETTQSINIGTGGEKNVTVGSVTDYSPLSLQGGTGGIRMQTSGGFAVHLNQANTDVMTLHSNGNIEYKLLSNTDFQITRESDNHTLLSVGDDGIINTAHDSHLEVAGTAKFNQGITIQGNTTYRTPNGYDMGTAIGIPNYAVGGFSSIFAFGLPADSSPTARGMLVADARTGNHQATIGVLSPDESAIMGFSWNGSNSTGYITNTANSLALQGGGVNILTATNNGGAANVGIGNDGSAGHALDVTGDINASTNFSLGGVSILDSSSLKFNGAVMSKVEAASNQKLQLVADGGVLIGDGTATGEPTLLTLDRSTGTPTASGNAILGSMYYDTTLGKVQCYEADGWGSCSSSPDTYVSLNPSYANMVTHGDGIGELKTDFCSSALSINNGDPGEGPYCSGNETYNLYSWISPETTTQTKSVIVNYTLPENFKGFVDDSTSIKAQKGVNGDVRYNVYKSNPTTGLALCGETVFLPGAGTWEDMTTAGTISDPADCSFAAGDSIVFIIELDSKDNGYALISTINFAYKTD